MGLNALQLQAQVPGIPNLGAARSFGIVSGDSIYATDSVYVSGKVAALNSIGAYVQSSSNYPNGTSPFYSVYSTLDSLHNYYSSLTGTLISGHFDTTFNSGIYQVFGSDTIKGALQLTGDSTSLFVFLINANAWFDSTFMVTLNGIQFNQVFWVIDSGTCRITSNIYGSILAAGSVFINGNASNIYGRIFSKQSILIEKPIYISTKISTQVLLFNCNNNICGNLITNPTFEFTNAPITLLNFTSAFFWSGQSLVWCWNACSWTPTLIQTSQIGTENWVRLGAKMTNGQLTSESITQNLSNPILSDRVYLLSVQYTQRENAATTFEVVVYNNTNPPNCIPTTETAPNPAAFVLPGFNPNGNFQTLFSFVPNQILISTTTLFQSQIASSFVNTSGFPIDNYNTIWLYPTKDDTHYTFFKFSYLGIAELNLPPNYTVRCNQQTSIGLCNTFDPLVFPGIQFQWFLDGVLIPNATNQTYNVSYNAQLSESYENYTLRITYNNQSYDLNTSVFHGDQRCCNTTIHYTINLNSFSYDVFGNGSISLASQNIYINDNVTLNIENTGPSPLLSFINCNFLMGENAKIEVNNSNSLFFRDSHVFACGNMWDRIDLNEPTESLRAVNSIFEDGITAISSSNCSSLDIKNGNQFLNNWIGILVHSCNIIAPVSLVLDNKFDYTTPLPPPYPQQVSFAGLSLGRLSKIIIGNPIGSTNTLIANTFSHLQYGIYSTDSQYEIYGNIFENIMGERHYTAIFSQGHKTGFYSKIIGAANSGGTIHSNRFDFCNNSIELIEPNPPASLYNTIITSNRFNLCTNGVRVFNGSSQSWALNNKIRIYRNVFNDVINGTRCTETDFMQSPQYAIYNNQYNGYNRGIVIENTLGASIDNNILTGFTSGTPFGVDYVSAIFSRITNNSVFGNFNIGSGTNSIGIVGEQSPFSRVVCNDTRNHFANQATTGTMLGTTLFCNDMNGGGVGYLQIAGAIGPQLLNGNPQDNKWWGNMAWNLYNIQSNGNLSQFTHRSNNPYFPSLIGSLFATNPINPSIFTLNSPEECSCPGRIFEYEEEEEVDTNYVNNRDSVLTEIHDVLHSWTNNIDTSSCIVDSIADRIQHYAFCRAMSIDFIYDDADSMTQAKYDNSQGTNLYELAQAANILTSAICSTPYDTLKLNSCITILNSITPTDSIEQTAHIYLTLRVNMYMRNIGDTAYSEEEIATLFQLAQLCPYRIGMTVYEARSVLWYLFQEEFTNECELLSPDKSKSTKNKLLNEIIESAINRSNKSAKEYNYSCINPNPSKGFIQFNCFEDGKMYRCEIHDLNGKLLFTKNVQGNSISFDLSNGMYIYSIYADNVWKETGKLIISK